MNRNNWTRTVLGLALIGLIACSGETTEEEIVDEAPAPAMPEAAVLDATELQMNAAAHMGQTVRLNGMNVQSTVGTNAVWVELPNKNPFLVHTMTPPAAGTRVDIVGTVNAITPEIVAGWVSAGAITENDQLVVEFATHYIEAQAIEPAAGM